MEAGLRFFRAKLSFKAETIFSSIALAFTNDKLYLVSSLMKTNFIQLLSKNPQIIHTTHSLHLKSVFTNY